ncbi:MAG TPA: VWA domain-containing protein [Acidisarcina sp.]
MALLLAASLLLAANNAWSQQETPPDIVIKATVRRVILDVVVTDSFGKPVQGLTRKDFSVLEDGSSQRILSFDSHELGPAPEPPRTPQLPANTFLSLPTEAERGPLYVLLLDLVNTEVEDQITARSRISEFIKNKPPGTRFAIFVLSDELRMVQGFTSEPGLLYAALDTHQPKQHVPMVFLYGANHGRHDPSTTLDVFEHLAAFLNGMPGRKNILWISGAYPLQLFATRDDGPNYTERTKRMLDNMARNQISIYPIDARGVVVYEATGPAGSSSASMTSGSSAGSNAGLGRTFSGSAAGGAGSGPGAGAVGPSELVADYQSADEIARVTGGHAFHSNNNIEGLLTNATEEGASYYEVSYSPTNQKYNGALRSIEVRLARKGYHLDYRRNYYGVEDGTDPQMILGSQQSPAANRKPARPVGDSLDIAMEYGAPMAHDLLFKAHVYAVGQPALGTPEQMANLADQPAYFKVRKKNKPVKPMAPIKLQTYAIDYTLPVAQSRSMAGQADTPAPRLEVASAAYDADGQLLNGEVNDATQSEPPSSADLATPAAAQPTPASKTFYRLQQQIDVPMTATSIRIAVRDINTNRLGTIEVSLPLAPEAEAQAQTAPGVH